MKEETGVALIGYGFVGENFHAPLIDATDGLKLSVVSSSRPEKVRERFPHVKVASTPDEAIHDAAIALVVIASPNTSHVPLTAAALKAGKHVVCDKPFTITTGEARELADLAAQEGRLLSVFHNRRWDADFLTLRKLIAEDTLGPINYFESHIDRFRPIVRDRWREQAGPGSGMWYDLGPHMIDQVLQLFGPPETVQATILAQRPGAVTDDYAHVVLGYPSGMQAVLHGSMLAPGGSLRFLVHGSKASWRKYGQDLQEHQLISGMRPGDSGWAIDPVAGTLFTGTTSGRNEPATESSLPNVNGAYENYYAGVRDAILGAAHNPVPAEQAVQVMAVLEAAIESAHSARKVPFQS